jgi:hypothetical protein
LLSDLILNTLRSFEPSPELVTVLIKDLSQAPSGELRQDNNAPPQIFL